jgi:hypothetical protein
MRIRLAGVLGALLILGLAGCGDAADGNGVATVHGATNAATPSAGNGPSNERETALAHARCMRDNGVPNFPDPVFNEEGGVSIDLPKGTDIKTVQAAEKKCAQFQLGGGEPPKPDPELAAKLRDYAKCMREHGVAKFPDPGADGGIAIQGGPGLDPMSPEFKAAEQACAHIMPKGPGGGGQNSSEEGE